MLPEQGLYHTCYSVPDIEAAKTSLGKAFGLTWTASVSAAIRVQDADGAIEDVSLAFCYSLQGPPYIELVQGPPGHRFFAAQGEGHVHHVGLFVADLDQAIEEYEAMGLPKQFTMVDPAGNVTGLSYHHNPFGASIELVSLPTRAVVQSMIEAGGGDT